MGSEFENWCHLISTSADSVTTTVSVTAAVITTGVETLPVLVVVVVAVNLGIEAQFTRQQGVHCLISTAADATVELDTCLLQSCLSPSADAAADQYIRFNGQIGRASCRERV